MLNFAQLGLSERLTRVLEQSGVSEPFPIQEAAIPDALAGRDVSGKAPTGSGKTLAFGLPVISRVGKAGSRRPRALILAPTRELADQIKVELHPLAKSVGRSVIAIYGGVGYGPQVGGLRKGVDILVATPGRLEDLMSQGSVDLGLVDLVVIDEADRMADMGFLPAVRRILDQTSDDRQTLLFSATLDGDIAVLSRDYQREPVRHEAPAIESDALDAQHHFWLVQHGDRVRHTADVVHHSGRSIVFTRTRHGADRVARQLTKLGVAATAMHGGLSQNQRTRSLRAFSSGNAMALVATDVAARGIHVDEVATVIHFDPPGDHKDYLHRSGRTARAGATGLVVSMVTGDQRRDVRRMQRDLDMDAPIEAPRMDALGEMRGEMGVRGPGRTGKRSQSNSERPVNRPNDQRQPTKSLYVANLPWSVTSDDLETLFSGHGEVVEATVIMDRRSGRSRGFGFVDITGGSVEAVVAALNGSTLGGRTLKVRTARPRS
ncbi:MAG: DEAD/DEAH box helicase [Acidimicrobiia bacterium]